MKVSINSGIFKAMHTNSSYLLSSPSDGTKISLPVTTELILVPIIT